MFGITMVYKIIMLLYRISVCTSDGPIATMVRPNRLLRFFCYYCWFHKKMYCLFEYTKNTWTIYFVYVLKASPNANHLKRVNAHAFRRELPTFVLDDSIILAIFENKNLKSGCSSYMSCLLLCYHTHFCFKGWNTNFNGKDSNFFRNMERCCKKNDALMQIWPIFERLIK